MSDINQWLKKGDPLAGESGEPELSAIDAQVMRRTIVAAANSVGNVRTESRVRPSWPGSLAMAAGVAACLIVGISVGLRFPSERGRVAETPAAPVTAKTPPRQMQFVTTGGTRVIWTFSDDFKL